MLRTATLPIDRSRVLSWLTIVLLAGCSTATSRVADDDDDDATGDDDAPVEACVAAERQCGMWQLDEQMVDCGGCGDAMACNTDGACEATDTSAGAMGVITLVHRSNLYDSLATKLASTATAEFAPHVAPPADARQVFMTDEDERCYVETDPDVYPYWVAGQHWPPRPLMDAGTLTISATSAPGPVRLDTLAVSTIGTLYRHTDMPEPLKQDTTTFVDWFEAGYFPAEQPYEISVVGSAEIPAFTTMAGMIPAAPTGFTPGILREAQVGDRPTIDLEPGQPIRVAWTPMPGKHSMEIEYNAYTSNSELRLKCEVDDDGEVMIPYEPVKDYFRKSTTTLFFRRRQVRTLHPVPGNDQIAITVDAANEVLGLVFTRE